MSEEGENNNSRDKATENLFDFSEREEVRKERRVDDDHNSVNYNEELSLQNIFLEKGDDEGTLGSLTPGIAADADQAGKDSVVSNAEGVASFGGAARSSQSSEQTANAIGQVELTDSQNSDQPGALRSSGLRISQNASDEAGAAVASAAAVADSGVGQSQSQSTQGVASASNAISGSNAQTGGAELQTEPRNAAPNAGGDSSTAVDEGGATILGRLVATDADQVTDLVFSVGEGFSAPDGFLLNGDGSYSFDPAVEAYDHLNVGDSQILSIPITVTDDEGATDTAQLQISVVGTNDTPVAGADVALLREEGAIAVKGQLTSTDVDDGATATFSMASGISAPEGFSLQEDGSYSFDSSVQAYDHLNVGDIQVVTIPVVVTDEHGATDSSQIQITVVGTNDAPIAGADVFSRVQEGASTVGGQLNSTDVDDNAALSFTITAGGESPDGFVLNADGSYAFDPADAAYEELGIGDSQVLTIPVTVTDEHGATDTSLIQITVLGTNDAPVAGANIFSTVEEGADGISGQLVSSDSDSDAAASYSITEGSSAPDGFVMNADGSYSFDPSDEAYDHLNVGDSTVLTIPVTVTDDQGATDSSQIQITITGTNDAPVAGADVVSKVDEGVSAINGQLTATDLDDDSTATFSIAEGVDAPDGFEMNADGSYSFDPSDEAYDHLNVGDSTVLTIPVTVTDDQGATDTSQIQITVVGTNDAPVAGADVAAKVEEGASAIKGQLTSTDLDDDSTATFSIAEGVDAPDGFEMNADGSYSFDPSDEAYDHLNVGDSTLLTIPVTVTDDQGATDTSQIQITVVGTNDAPVAGADVAAKVEEGASKIKGQLSSTDLDDDSTAKFSVTEGAETPDGFEMNADGTYSFDPSDEAYDHLNVGDSTVLTIPVTVTDDQGATDTSQIQITVVGTNDAPVAGADVAAKVEEGASTIKGQLTSTDLDDDSTATFSIAEGVDAPDGFEMNADGSYSFDPSDEAYDHLNVGDSTVLTIPVTVTDDQGATDTSQIQITVVGTNDAPVAGADLAAKVEEGASAIKGQLTSTDLDDDSTAKFSVTEGAETPDGFEMNADGTYSFDPSDEAYDHLNVGDSTVLTIPVTVTDDQGATDTSQIQITVVGTNDAPVAGADVAAKVEEGASAIKGQLTSTDLDDDSTAKFSVTEGAETPDGFEMNADGTYSFDPSDEAYDHLNVGDSTVLTIPITVTDDQGATDTSQIQITVVGTNDAPVAGADIAAKVAEGASTIKGQITSTDLDDGSTATFSITEGADTPDGFEMNADGSYSFDPSDEAYDHLNVGDSTVLTIPVTVTDDQGATDTSQIQITVTGTNDAPVAGADVAAKVEEGASAIKGQLTSTDLDDDSTATFSIAEGVDAPDGFEMNADGSYSFDPADEAYDHLNVGDSTVLTIPVTVTDDQGATDTSQIQITVTGTNDAPVAGAAVSNTVDEGSGAISGQMTSTDVDDGATATYSIANGDGAPDGFELNADGSYTFDSNDAAYDHLAAGDSQVLDIPVTVTDDQGATDTSNIQITVTGTNDAPTAISATGGTVEENVGAGTVVADLSATDADDGDALSFSLAGDSSLFEVQGDQIVVKDGAQINYEADTEHTLTVQVTDAAGESFEQDITIEVTDINETPTDITLSDDSVNENAAGGTVVADISAADEDAGESFTYELTDESGLFEISGDQIVVKEGAEIDFESDAVHDITVKVTDSGGNSYDEPFSIQVNDLVENSGPIATDDTLTSSFTPENATLTVEINFDDGVPEAARGSIAAEESGQVGNAADFSNGKLSVDGLDLSGEAGDQTTVSMWIQGTPEGSWEMMAASDIYDMVLYDGNIGFNTGGGDLFGSDASELADGEWHHVVGIFTNGDLTENSIFIDGVPQEMSQIRGTPSESRANIDSDDGTMHFGGWGVNDGYRFTGSMDEIKVFDGDLSPEEVTSLYDIESGHDHWQNSGQGGAEEDTALVIDPNALIGNDVDPDGDTLSIVAVDDAEHGTVELNEDGEIVFTPDANYNGEASFSYTVSDGNGGTDTATVNLEVASVNDLPVIEVVNTVAVDEDGKVSINYKLDDIDSESVDLEGTSENGTVTVNDDGTMTFTPDENFNGDTSITLTATDSDGGVSTKTIDVDVAQVNDGPVAGDDNLSGSFTPENATLTAEINFDDGVPEAARGSVTVEESGQVGNAADFSNGRLSVDGMDLSSETGDQTTVSMWIQGDPEGSWEMMAASDIYDMVLYDGNIGFNTGGGDLFGSDASELADGEWHHVVGIFTNGDLTQNSIFIDGVPQEMSQIRGTPSESRANIDSDDGTMHFGGWGVNDGYRFTGSMDEIKVFDGDLSLEEVAALYEIEAGHDHWENSGQGGAEEDTALIINPNDLVANDIDPDGDTLSIVAVDDAEHGTVELNENGEIVFTPDANYNGEASFSYTVSDGNGGTDTATVTLDVASVNDLPVIEVVNTISVDEDGTVSINYKLDDIDSESVNLEGTSENGTVTINEDGTMTFTPNEDFTGDASITLTATDSDGGITTKTIDVDVTQANDAPVAGDDVSTKAAEGGDLVSGQLTSTDTDEGATATWSMSEDAEAPAGFTLNEDGSYQFDPADEAYDHLNVGDSTTLNVPVTVTDDQGATDTSQIQITVSGTNDAPIVDSHKISAEEGGATVTGSLPASDVDDGAELTFSASGKVPEGFTLNDDGTYEFDPADEAYDSYGAGESHTEAVTYTVTDEHGESSEGVLYVGVEGTNDTVNMVVDTNPQDNSIPENAVKGSPVGLVAKAEDADGDEVSYSIVDSDGQTVTDGPFAVDASSGVVTVNDPSQIDYEDSTSHDLNIQALSADGSSTQDSFSIQITDIDENVGPEAQDDVGRVWVSETTNEIVENLQVGSFDGERADVSDWGELVDGKAVFQEGDITVTTSVSDGELTAYNKTGHVGFGIGNNDNDGLDKTETLIVEIDGGDTNRIEFTLDGLGSYFDESSRNATEVKITAYDHDGNLIETQGGYRESGSTVDTYSFETETPAQRFEITSEGSNGNFVVQSMNLSATDTIQVPGHWENVSEDGTITIDVLANDTDENGDALSIVGVESSVVVDGVEVGTAEIVDVDGQQQIQFTPGEAMQEMSEGESQNVSFEYQVSDGEGGVDSAKVNLTVEGADEAPADEPEKSRDDGIRTRTAVDETDKSEASESKAESSEQEAATIEGTEGDDNIKGTDGDDVITGGVGDDQAWGGEGNDTYIMNSGDGSDYFDGGAGGGWTDSIALSADPADGDSPWSITVDGEQVEYDLAAGALDLQPDTSGVITLADGSELAFDGIESINW